MPTSLPVLLLAAIAVFVLSGITSRIALAVLTRRGVLDHPNARSTHARPIPRGGGIGFMAVILVAMGIAAATGEGHATLSVLVGAAFIVAISFADDLRSRSRLVRLTVQAIAIATVLATMPDTGPVLAAGLPLWLDRLLLAIAWLWFVNLFNFMDGIDGIAAGEATIIALGVIVLALASDGIGLPALDGAIIGAAAFGFLTVNWSPARVFMGDSGSAGLGFVLGWLLMDTANAGLLAGALILPLVFVGDASWTLLTRLARGQAIASPHRDHAYQIAVDRGLSHRRVAGLVVVTGLALIALALGSRFAPLLCLAVAAALTAGLLAWFRLGGGPQFGRGQSSR